jgi:hypothetical protein
MDQGNGNRPAGGSSQGPAYDPGFNLRLVERTTDLRPVIAGNPRRSGDVQP